MKKLLLCAMFILISMNIAKAADYSGKVKVRVKDVARIKGFEEYSLIGYGIVTGLNGSGDSDSTLIQSTLSNVLNNFNIKVSETDLKAANCAAVMITLVVDKSAHKGDMIQATISSVGDAKSLTGGTLLMSSIKGEDNTTWATAQGPITTGGYSFGSDSEEGGNQVVKNHPTVGILANGAKLVKDIETDTSFNDVVTFYLNSPDFTTAVNFEKAVNEKFIASAVAKNSSTLNIQIPAEYKAENRVTEFISELEQLLFTTDQEAKVVFNEKTGTIVVGGNVKISAVAIAHGNVTVDIQKVSEGVTASPFEGDAQIEKTNNTKVNIDEPPAKLFPIPNTTTINDLVKVLNDLGVSPRDMMLIFLALQKSGALHAKIESM